MCVLGVEASEKKKWAPPRIISGTALIHSYGFSSSPRTITLLRRCNVSDLVLLVIKCQPLKDVYVPHFRTGIVTLEKSFSHIPNVVLAVILEHGFKLLLTNR